MNNFSEVLVQSSAFQSHYLINYNIKSKVVYNYTLVKKSEVYLKRTDFSTIVYAGNVGSLQNFDGIVDLFLTLRRGRPLVFEFLEIYGEGSLLEYYRNKYADTAGITFFGRVSTDEVVLALERARYAIFSLVDGPIQYTLPSRLQFFYNLNIPIIYLGQGAVCEFLKETNGGISFKDPLAESNIKKLLIFEDEVFETKDFFNKNNIVKEIKELLL